MWISIGMEASFYMVAMNVGRENVLKLAVNVVGERKIELIRVPLGYVILESGSVHWFHPYFSLPIQ
jgi:hypothetical protein